MAAFEFGLRSGLEVPVYVEVGLSILDDVVRGRGLVGNIAFPNVVVVDGRHEWESLNWKVHTERH